MPPKTTSMGASTADFMGTSSPPKEAIAKNARISNANTRLVFHVLAEHAQYNRDQQDDHHDRLNPDPVETTNHSANASPRTITNLPGLPPSIRRPSDKSPRPKTVSTVASLRPRS